MTTNRLNELKYFTRQYSEFKRSGKNSKVKAIDDAASGLGENGYYILISETKGLTYEKMKERGMPIERSEFYRLRRQYYILLDTIT